MCSFTNIISKVTYMSLRVSLLSPSMCLIVGVNALPKQQDLQVRNLYG